jgi:hypothetical protein
MLAQEMGSLQWKGKTLQISSDKSNVKKFSEVILRLSPYFLLFPKIPGRY